jgi:hypothetical protein
MSKSKDEKSVAEVVREKRAEQVEKQAAVAEAKAKAAESSAIEAAVAKMQAKREAARVEESAKSVLKIRDAQAERQEALVKEIQKWRPKKASENDEPVGVWKSEYCIRKLGLDKLDPDEELIYDVVPNPGCSTNGVVFAPGSRQLLPEHIWKDIQGRTSTRIESEKDFLYPKGKVALEPVYYSGRSASGLGHLAKLLDG